MEKAASSDEKYKHREADEYKKLIHRLNRVEGQIGGVRKMVEEEMYCVEILTQVSAIQAALNACNKELLSNHMQTCVVEDIKNGDRDVVYELCDPIEKLMK